MLNFFPMFNQDSLHTSIPNTFQLIPTLIQRTSIAAVIGYFYGRIFEFNASLSAKVFAISELARSVLFLAITYRLRNYRDYQYNNRTEQRRYKIQMLVDVAGSMIVGKVLHELHLINRTGLLALSVLHALYFMERAGLIASMAGHAR
ncbi:hypothetical protein [Candidatus Protochlamydia phocaeensis]|uniref:hypothetical protein n=1 Tax=Candidatus Protochlamydia phocaeensis TaxID=1414722 RepID=UPI0008394C51|nr:hypothetical protein [Candidatus Protochlamydia phocaeensis]